ncbi:MAG TPA: serpin family protein [Candidatus Rubrimentiphilum sp.]|nr:serpin family protein [Candidatus Rubrimentiphilum sp.]
MKRWLILAFVLGTLSAAAPAPKPANYDAFGFALLQKLAPQAKNQNVFISPLSIGMALSMAADGAAGQTRAAIAHTLGYSGGSFAPANASLMSALAGNHDAKVGVANALWFRQDIPPKAAYVSLLKKSYGAQAQALQFGNPSAAAAINAWTKAHTLGLIDQIITQTQKSDFAYLTNALAFQADWSQPFKKNDTRPRPFTNADGSKPIVPTMTQTGTFKELDGKYFSALRMPYGKGGYAAYVILPNKGVTSAMAVRYLNAKNFDAIASAMQAQRLQVMIPKFTATYDTSLVGVLKSLGMGIAFSGAADFSPMHTPPPGLTISDIRHQAYVRVDEKGTTAAAATSVTIGITAIEEPPKQFVVDRPFVFALRDEQTGSLLFIGVINSILSS